MDIAKDVAFNLFALIFFGVFVAGVIASIRSKANLSAAVVAALVIAAAFCALMGNPDRFDSLKLSPVTGIEAKAREVIQKAEVTQHAFQKLATMTGELLIDLNAAQGRFVGGASERSEQDKRKQEIIEALRESGLPKEDIAQVSAGDRKWNVIDYINGIVQVAAKQAPTDRRQEWQASISSMIGDGSNWDTITPEQLHDLLARFGVLNEENENLIEDFRYYLKSGEQRRPEVWARRYRW